MDIVTRWPGSCHDSHIFNNSALKVRFESGEFGDMVLLGDSGYPLKNYLMTPILHPRTPAEELYNASHTSTRTVVERTFGIIKRRFPVLTCGIRCNLQTARKIIMAVSIVHNIAILNRDNLEEEEERGEEIGENLHLDERDDINLRQRAFVSYFQTLL